MSDRTSSWFYPKPTGDPGRDRNARTVQFACFLLAFAVGLLAVLNTIEGETQETPMLLFAAAGLFAAAAMNRAGRSAWAARTAFLSLVLTATLLVFEARDGFRSLAMLMFPGLLLISVMLLDRASYVATAVMVLVAVAVLGIAEKHGLTRAIPHVRTSTNYGSIFFVDLGLLIFALIGNRIARDTQSNVTELGTIIDQLSAANLALMESAEALRQSEVKYRRLHESITDAVVAVDMAGHILETNPTFQSMLGYTGEELCRMTSHELTPERWHAFEARIVAEQVLARGHSEVYEKEYRRRDGTVFPIELRTYLLRNESNQPIGLWTIVRDITERKRDEQAISEGEQRLRIAKDAAKLGIYQYDAATGTILWDARVRQLWGVGPDVPITLDTFFSGLHPEDRARTQVLLERALDPAGNGEYYAEYRVISHGDGSERWVAATGQAFFENGRAVHMIGTGQDISERKRAEAALRESEERFRAIFSQAAVGISLTSPDGVWLAVNDRFCKMLSYTESELRGKPFLEFTHPDDLEKSRDAAGRLLTGEIPSWQTEKRYLGKDGNVVWARVFVSLVRDPEGVPQNFIAVVEDISERIQSESALRESERRLSLALRAAQLGVWDCHLKKDEAVLSPKYREVYHRDPLTRAEWLTLVHPDDREQVVAVARESLSSTHQWDAEFRVLLPDGGIRWVHSSATVLVDEAEQPVRMVGVSHDVTERKQAEAALRESEERFRNMADTAPVMIWVTGPDKLFTFVNKTWLDFTGRTMDQEMDDGWAEGVHPHDLERCLAMYTSSFDARRGFRMEYRLRRFDGEYRWLLNTGAPRYREGEFTGYIGSCIDVTERKLTEERLRANEARLMDAQRLAKVGSWELDTETGRLHWSDEMFRIFGEPRDAQPDFDMFLGHVHPKDLETIVESRATVVARATPIDLEFRIVRSDGNVRFVRAIVQAIKNDLGAPLRFVGATQDITEQILASQHLRESEERLRNAERIAHVGNWAWDLKTNQLSWSKEVFRIYEQPEDFKPSYEGFVESIAPQDRDRVGQWVRDCLAKKKGSSIEHRIARPNGDLRTVSCTAEVLLDEEGMPVRLFGTCQDVTDVRREQEESFARQKLESVGTLAGGIAHDFNNLLGGVLGQAELALTELETGSAPEEELKAIREVALRGSEIVRQLMIYAGKESETIGPVDLSRIVAEMVELLKVSVSKHAVLVTDLGQDLPMLEANAAQIRRIVLNLVTNASQAIGNRDGVIRVSTGRVSAAQAAALAHGSAERDYLELEVSDNGCGMSLEMQSKVFDPFFTTRSAGHGLGLAVVQGIVRNLGGTIHLASEPDKGTTFRILMPCAPAAVEETAGSLSGAEEPSCELREATVLVVEDEDMLRQAVAKVLRRKGAEVLEAANGSAAIDLLRTKGSQIDVILLDLTIPGPSSQEVLAEAAQGWPDLKVILTSAYSEEMATANMGSPIVRCFIRKPFPLGDLVQTLRSVLSS